MTGLSAAHTAKGRLQRALLERLRVHERDGTLPTSGRFLFYELVQAGVVRRPATGVRRADQNLIDALTHLREVGTMVPWDWIEDETRSLDEWQTAPSVAEYVADAVDRRHPRPLGRRARAADPVRVPVAGRGALRPRGPLRLPDRVHQRAGPRLPDHQGRADAAARSAGALPRRLGPVRAADRGEQPTHPRRTHRRYDRPWERVALTDEQVGELNLPVISKARPPLRAGRSTTTRSKPRRSGRPASWPRCAPAWTS